MRLNAQRSSSGERVEEAVVKGFQHFVAWDQATYWQSGGQDLPRVELAASGSFASVADLDNSHNAAFEAFKAQW